MNDFYADISTPFLRLDNDGLTTVLLVNNKNHGRFISVKPEVISTARTFIQEGVTTEYATQVVGTTLDNGKVYAQFLKKSSRVLYDSSMAVPSVVTTWVGDSLNNNELLLPQSYNNLFNANQPNWEVIDGRLLGDDRRQDKFREKNYFMDMKRKASVDSNLTETEILKDTNFGFSHTTNYKAATKYVGGLEDHIENTRIAANKVSSVADLPTYTIKPNEAYTYPNDNAAELFKLRGKKVFDRNPKLIYNKLMPSSYKSETTIPLLYSSKSTVPIKRQFVTVTYYGFANFTTIVGDSVIVFSPSTSVKSAYYNNAYVTSIKGEATVAADSTKHLNISEVFTRLTTNIVKPTITQQQYFQTSLESGISIMEMEDDIGKSVTDTPTSQMNEIIGEKKHESMTILETSEVVTQPTQSTSLNNFVMLSRPSHEEILRIFNALANKNANGGTEKIQFRKTTEAETKAPNITSHIEKSSDNDQFNNFVDYTNNIITTEYIKKNYSSIVSEKTINANKPITTSNTATKQSSIQKNNSIVLIKESDLSEDNDARDSINTSPLFFTQLPNTLKNYETAYKAIDMDKLKTELKQKFPPTFEIKEATKYLIQTSQVKANEVKNSTVNTTLSPFLTLKADPVGKIKNENNTAIIFKASKDSLEELTIENDNNEIMHEHYSHGSNEDTDEYDDAKILDELNENDVSDEDIELIYKTFYTTYTYLTTFFHDDSISISSHIDVVTNVMTTTLGISSTQEFNATNIATNLNNDIKPSFTTKYIPQFESSNHFVLPSEIHDFIGLDEEISHDQKSVSENNESSNKTQSLTIFYTTYTYYTTIFTEGETEVISHTKVRTNVQKSPEFTAQSIISIPTMSSNQVMTKDNQQLSSNISDYNIITNNLSRKMVNSSKSLSIISPQNDTSTLPIITKLGFLSDDRFVPSYSLENVHIMNNTQAKIVDDHNLQHPYIYDDQISSESNTDTSEIKPSSTLLLQTSFTTFTYFTTMYNGDKSNVISRLETTANTVIETLQPTTEIELKGTHIPITYFTTFTYWTKLAREGQITTLSREETILSVITPTMVQNNTHTQFENQGIMNKESSKELSSSEMPIKNVIILPSSSEEKKNDFNNSIAIENTSNRLKVQHTASVLEPITYFTTYTYYTTSYETDNTITESRFETITNIFTPTLTLRNSSVDNKDLNVESSVAPTDDTQYKSVQTSQYFLYDGKEIIDADGISSNFFTNEVTSTLNFDGVLVEVTSSQSSSLISEENEEQQKQYKTGLVTLIKGTRIANQTTTLYESKVLGTFIDQRYAQIIESTSSLIFEKPKSSLDTASLTSTISPTSSSGDSTIEATQTFSRSGNTLENVEGSLIDISLDHKIGTETKPKLDHVKKKITNSGEHFRTPLQTKKAQFISSFKPFLNRSRPQFAPKRNSSATIITITDFTPTITVTPALKTISHFSSTQRGSTITSGSKLSGLQTFSRHFGRPIKSTTAATQRSGGFVEGSRNRFASSLNARGTFASSFRRIGGSTPTSRLSFTRPSLLSSSFAINSRLKVRPTAKATLSNVLSSFNTLTSTALNSPEDKNVESLFLDGAEDKEQSIPENIKNQNIPIYRFYRPLAKPQGFVQTPLQSISTKNTHSPRINLLTNRSRYSKTATSTTTTTTTTKPKSRFLKQPFISENRTRPRPTNSLFPPRFKVLQSAVTVEENSTIFDENKENENGYDSEYEDDGDEESETYYEEENRRRRRSSFKQLTGEKIRSKRESDNLQQNRSRFRNRFRRPKVASKVETEGYEDDASNDKEPVTGMPMSPQKTSPRFGARFLVQPSISDTLSTVTSSYHTTIRPTRLSSKNSGRAQFTLREKNSSSMSPTQKGLNPVQRPIFRKSQLGVNASSRRLPSYTTPSFSSSSGKKRLKSFTTNELTTTPRSIASGRTRSSGTSNGRSRSSAPRKENNSGGRNRGRSSHNYNNYNEALILDSSGTITVTHLIPADITIPVVNGQVTEYKQVITAKTSTEVLGPQQYTTTLGANGMLQLALTRKDLTIKNNGVTEVTQYIVHETPTTTVTFTPTKIRGRKTSFSHVLPSTVYMVEEIVSTVQPQISANVPLANILLSQLLLGNAGLPTANPLLGAFTQSGFETAVDLHHQPTPLTEYKTRASTYITTVYEGQSTVIPITFQGKKILTTIYDTASQTITATEYITDTIITTPTVTTQQHQPLVNSLLLQQLLLQEHLQQQQKLQQAASDPAQPLNAILNSVPPQFLLGGDNLQQLEVTNNIRDSERSGIRNEGEEYSIEKSTDTDEIGQSQLHANKNSRKKNRKPNKNSRRKQNNSSIIESSVVTLYVSGRKPGEFSTVLSTVKLQTDATVFKRHAPVIYSETDFLNDGSEFINQNLFHSPGISIPDAKNKNKVNNEYEPSTTQSLESIVGDVSLWYATAVAATSTKLHGSITKLTAQI